MTDPRDELLELIRTCKITPAEGEAKAALRGLEPLNPPPDPAHFNPASLDDWTFVMAIAWIAGRTLDKVREYWDDYCEAGFHWFPFKTCDSEANGAKVRKICNLEQNKRPLFAYLQLEYAFEWNGKAWVIEPSAAQAELWRKLRLQAIIATAIDPAAGKRVAIPAVEFQDLKIANDLHEDYLLNSISKHIAYRLPTLSREAVMREWPQRSPSGCGDSELSTGRKTAIGATNCKAWLIGQMNLSIDQRPKPKIAFYREAVKNFKGLGGPASLKPSRAFDRAWTDAISATGAKWDQPGAPKKNPRTDNPRTK